MAELADPGCVGLMWERGTPDCEGASCEIAFTRVCNFTAKAAPRGG